MWSKAIEKAALPGVTPHTLRHTMGSTATSMGEALALTGAILGHANPRSTAIYAHVQSDPSKRAANRVTKKIAFALGGKASKTTSRKAAAPEQIRVDEDDRLIHTLAERLAEDGPNSERLRAAITQAISGQKLEVPPA